MSIPRLMPNRDFISTCTVCKEAMKIAILMITRPQRRKPMRRPFTEKSELVVLPGFLTVVSAMCLGDFVVI